MNDDEIEIIPIELIDPRDTEQPAPAPTEAPPGGQSPPDAPVGDAPMPAGSRRSPPWRLLFGAVAAAAIVAVVYVMFRPDSSPPEDESAVADETTTTTTLAPAISAEVYARVVPSVVYIQTEYTKGDEQTTGVGAGVIVNVDGDILTAHHVVADATNIRVRFADGTETGAAAVFVAPEDDIAVLAPDRSPAVTVPAVLAGTNRLRVGDEAYAVGNPLGLPMSLSAGVISGFDRTVPIDDERNLDGLIQFDTAVNPGNSGGPLLDRYGQVIGIVTALANPTEGQDFSGIGFAITIETAFVAARVPGQ